MTNVSNGSIARIHHSDRIVRYAKVYKIITLFCRILSVPAFWLENLHTEIYPAILGLNFRVFGHLQGIINLNTQVPYCTFQFCMTQ